MIESWKLIRRLSGVALVGFLTNHAIGAAEPKPSPVPPVVAQHWTLDESKRQLDFPDFCVAKDGTIWTAFVDFDGKADRLKLGRLEGDSISVVAELGEPGVIHNPSLTVDRNGDLWIFHGRLGKDGVVSLHADQIRDGEASGKTTVLARSAGSDTFVDSGVDSAGRVWAVWQSLRRGQADIYCRWVDPKTGDWSDEIRVTKAPGGHWEPRVAFAKEGGAWIVYDSSRGGEFNLFLTSVSPQGKVVERRLTDSPDYEARASICADAESKGFWIAAERGRRNWGKDSRSHLPTDGLNARKRILLGRFDIASGAFNEVKVAGQGQPFPKGASNVNLPEVGLTPAGVPLLAYRSFIQNRWLLTVARFNPRTGQWTRPVLIPNSAFGQDRRATLLRDKDKQVWLGWSADKRINKLCLTAGVHLARLEPPKLKNQPKPNSSIRFLDAPEPYLVPPTPDRPREEHHTWTIDGETYTLLWGDLHRHTDFSNCRTGFDGCIVEHYRYAYDMAALDFLGTSDHTDIAKIYDPYEWWQTQKLVDVFHAPGRFHSLYAYEREQRFPWGHRNVVFAQRGGPIVYIKRKLYENSPWHALYPTRPGGLEISPMELWGALRQYGGPVSVISHTGASGMGTDWDKYERIDNRLENIVEIFQGARVSYEALGAPQPTVGLKKTEPYTPATRGPKGFPKPPAPIEDFRNAGHNRGVYQRALHNGFKLGVFASSDHISTHVSFGGVYVKELTREGIIEGFNARRTVAATDKIFIEFTVNGAELGSVIQSTGKKPELRIRVNGTAPIKRITVVRNEQNHKFFFPGKPDFTTTWTDPKPAQGENRYYLRIEQEDGNMGWSSPVWVEGR